MKIIQSTFTAIALGFLFSIPYAAPIDAAAKFNDTLDPMTIAKLPVCNSNSSGSRATINDFSGTGTWNGALATGGGAGVALVYCDGGSWKFAAGGAAAAAPPPPPSTAMPAPSISLGNATLGNYATGCSAGSCLVFEDQFNGTTVPANHGGATNISDLWVPYLANAIGSGTFHRWSSLNTSAGSFIPWPYNGGTNCPVTPNNANPPWNFCGTRQTFGIDGIDDSYNPFPYGYNSSITTCNGGGNCDDGDGNHMLGGASNGNQLTLILSPGKSTTVQPASTQDGSFPAASAWNNGIVWTSAGISGNFNNTTAVTGRRAMNCPNTGCYVQIRAKQPDCSSGAWSGMGFYQADSSGTSGSNEFDLNECGFINFGNAGQPANANQVASATLQGTGSAICNSQFGVNPTNASNPECQYNSPSDLSQGYHVWGVEYIPRGVAGGPKISAWLDGTLIGTWSDALVGNRAYAIYFDMDIAYGLPWRSNQSWPTSTTNCCSSPPNVSFTYSTNDIQVYKLPGQ